MRPANQGCKQGPGELNTYFVVHGLIPEALGPSLTTAGREIGSLEEGFGKKRYGN